MVDPVAALRAKSAQILAEAQRRAEALDADARELERLATLADKYGFTLVEKASASANGATSGIATEGDSEGLEPIDENSPAYKMAILASERALKAAGGPLELNQLFDACLHLGVQIGGKRPLSTLSAYLAHEKSTVESIRKGVYWLKGTPIPRTRPHGDVLISNPNELGRR